MITVYLIIAIVALCLVIAAMWKINRSRVKALNEKVDLKQREVDTLQDEISDQQEEIRKRDQMIDTLQEIEIDHIKKSKKLRTPDASANVRNASSIMQNLRNGDGDSNKDGSSS